MTDERVAAIDEAIENAINALSQIPDEERSEGVETLEQGLAFARMSLYATEPSLITEPARETLWHAAQVIADDIHVAPEQRQYHDQLVAATLMLPASHDRDVEQVAKEAAATYQRAMSQRMKQLEDQASAVSAALSGTHQEIEEATARVTTSFDEKAVALQQMVDTLAGKIEAH